MAFNLILLCVYQCKMPKLFMAYSKFYDLEMVSEISVNIFEKVIFNQRFFVSNRITNRLALEFFYNTLLSDRYLNIVRNNATTESKKLLEPFILMLLG